MYVLKVLSLESNILFIIISWNSKIVYFFEN